jgi:hypothetical protein
MVECRLQKKNKSSCNYKTYYAKCNGELKEIDLNPKIIADMNQVFKKYNST